MEFNAEFEKSNEVAPIVKLAQLNHKTVANTIINGIVEGNVEPLKVHMFLKRVEKVIEQVKENEDVKASIKKEAELMQGSAKNFDYMGAKLNVGAVHTYNDYSACGDPLWDNLNELSETIKKMTSERETFLKNAFPESNSLFGVQNPTVVVHNLFSLTPMDCGEEVTLMRPIKKQTMGVVTRFPK